MTAINHTERVKQALLNTLCALDVYNELINSDFPSNNLYLVLKNSLLVNIYANLRALLSTKHSEESFSNLIKNDENIIKEIAYALKKDPKTLPLLDYRNYILGDQKEQYASLKKYINKSIFHYDPKKSPNLDLTASDINGIVMRISSVFDELFAKEHPIQEIDRSTLSQQASVSFRAISMIGKE